MVMMMMCEPGVTGGGQPGYRRRSVGTMLGRSAVSYQNIGPGSGIFSPGAQMGGGRGHDTWASQHTDTGTRTPRQPSNR